jgi:hypothetical protein
MGSLYQTENREIESPAMGVPGKSRNFGCEIRLWHPSRSITVWMFFSSPNLEFGFLFGSVSVCGMSDVRNLACCGCKTSTRVVPPASPTLESSYGTHCSCNSGRGRFGCLKTHQNVPKHKHTHTHSCNMWHRREGWQWLMAGARCLI